MASSSPKEIASFKKLGVYEELPRERATSTLLPARPVLVTKPNVHGGPARKKARIVICGNFQDVHLAGVARHCLEDQEGPVRSSHITYSLGNRARQHTQVFEVES